MYQWLIQTLIIAVITIITTILTVKSTMRGYIVSPEAKGKLTSSARRYGETVFLGLVTLLSAVGLVFYLNRDEPLTRFTVFGISFAVTGTVCSLLATAFTLGRAIGSRKSLPNSN